MHHAEATLADAARPGTLACQVELACNGLFGEQDAPVELTRCELGRFDPAAWSLAADFEVLRALEAHRATEPAWAALLRRELERFCDEQDPAILAALYEHANATHAHEIVAVGHAHIDTAWLWPLAETYRKTLRSFSTAVRYMDEYPEYRFACSQAQQYAWIKERNPDLWARIRAKVESGQFVPVGGTWIEPDFNLPSGESLVRQLLHGQRFFERELGIRCTELWAPDAFGYNGQLPQLMRGAGITRFLTQKLSWNRFNKPEESTLVWQGIDGSEVLAHFPPADDYNSMARVDELVKIARESKSLDHSGTSMLVYGYGDGGGGPTREMLETLRRARDLQGLPRTRTGHAAGVLRRARGRAGGTADGRRRALLRVPPRHVHDAGVREARQPAVRAGAARRGAPRRRARRPVPAGGARPAVEAPPAPAVPRHPSRLVDPARVRRRRARLRRARRRASRR